MFVVKNTSRETIAYCSRKQDADAFVNNADGYAYTIEKVK
jgi:hypothetical protein